MINQSFAVTPVIIGFPLTMQMICQHLPDRLRASFNGFLLTALFTIPAHPYLNRDFHCAPRRSSLRTRREQLYLVVRVVSGGPGLNRTAIIFYQRESLCQLSYRPVLFPVHVSSTDKWRSVSHGTTPHPSNNATGIAVKRLGYPAVNTRNLSGSLYCLTSGRE